MSFKWIPSSSHAAFIPNSVLAGNDSDGSQIYVGRAHHEGDLLPAKVIPSKQAAYVSYNGKEILKPHFEVLTGSGMTWIPSSNGNVPSGAIFTGKTSTGELLYIGRAQHQGSTTPGKVHKSHGCLYLPYNGTEHSHRIYEVLVGAKTFNWKQTSANAALPSGAIHAGHDTDGSQIYVGRALHQGDQIPAKVIPSKHVAYVSWGGQEHSKQTFEVLCNGNVSWLPSGHGRIVANAIKAGKTSSGEDLYVGRAYHQGSLTPGKIQPSHQTLYIPFNGSEVPVKIYEILVEKKNKRTR